MSIEKRHLKLVAQGSAKDLYASDTHSDSIFVEFTDRVSVFDYGALPELIPGRGAALLRSALQFEDIFAKAKIPTAFDPKLSRDTNMFVMRKASASKFFGQHASATLSFIPLEVIFRWGVPPGSSLLQRRPEFDAFARFQEPLIEFSTKFEATDRYLSNGEAAELVGSAELLAKVESLAHNVAHVLQKTLKGIGLELWDGKIECAWDVKSKQVILVDALTPDELRASFPGLSETPLSKELLRQWLGNTLWAWEVSQSKKRHGENWKSHVSLPPRLGLWRETVFAQLYQSFAHALETSNPQPLLRFLRETQLAGKLRSSQSLSASTMEKASSAAIPKVYVMGSGGREAALKWRLELEGCEIAEDMVDADAVMITQDADLAAGKVDELLKQRFWISGPTKSASKIEWSKLYGRQIAQEAKIPMAKSGDRFDDIRCFDVPPVVKFDGLAAGKGVVVSKTFEEAEKAFQTWSQKGKVLLEERLEGYEASVFFWVHTGARGPKLTYLGTAQDFKRRYAGDEGPNTGGMGAICPHPKITSEDVALFQDWALQAVTILANHNAPYNGVLYLGLLKDKKKGWNLLEFNARPGDPETQSLVMNWPHDRPLLRSLLGLDVQDASRPWSSDVTTLCIAMVRPEYPNSAPELKHLPSWNLKNVGEQLQLFRNSSMSGRVAYLVANGKDQRQAADLIFAELVECPWKEILEWRADLLP